MAAYLAGGLTASMAAYWLDKMVIQLQDHNGAYGVALGTDELSRGLYILNRETVMPCICSLECSIGLLWDTFPDHYAWENGHRSSWIAKIRDTGNTITGIRMLGGSSKLKSRHNYRPGAYFLWIAS